MALKFIIRKKEYSSKTFRMPLELVEELQTVAQSNKISLTQLVINCCEFALENLEEMG